MFTTDIHGYSILVLEETLKVITASLSLLHNLLVVESGLPWPVDAQSRLLSIIRTSPSEIM